jgi:Bacterial Ig-like domain (group 3)
MRTTSSRYRRVVAGLAVAAIPFTILAAAPVANAANPDGSVYELFLEKDLTGDPANALGPSNWWSQTGAGKTAGLTTVSADLTGGEQAFLDAFAAPNFDNLVVAFAPTSATGANERPVVTAGEKIGEAFPYFTVMSPFTSFGSANGEPIHTQGLWDGWVADGKPDQIFRSSDLKMIDALRPGTPVSAFPQATSLFNTWAAGTDMSLVVVKFDHLDASGEPILTPGPDGRVFSAWLPFKTVSDPDRAVSTSGGWQFAVAPATATTTTLAATPASPQQSGTAVTLNANVSPAAAGSVEFKDGSTVFATVPVTAGAASTTTSALSVGTHSLTASFVPTDPAAFAPSTSAPLSYQITGIPATPTTTALAVPATATAGDSVPFTATVSPTAAAGTVQFKDGATDIGAPVAVVSGVATSSWTATVGGHNITAVFTPANPANFAASTSTPQTLQVAPAAGTSTDDATIVADVDAGAINISTPYTPTNPLNLGTLALDAGSTQYSASATFQDIVVTDTRAGSLPWVATALAGNLTSGSNVINGQNVGLTNLVADSNVGAGVVTVTNNPAANPAVGPATGGSLGLGGTPKTILTSTAGPGTAHYHGTLTLNAPTTTQAGHYTGTVTFTVS